MELNSSVAIGQIDELYRRGRIKWVNPNGTATSRVFKLRPLDSGKLSTDLKRLTTSELAIKNKEEFNLFEITVEDIWALSLDTVHDSLPENIAHSYIWGMNEEDDIAPGLLARKSRRINFI